MDSTTGPDLDSGITARAHSSTSCDTSPSIEIGKIDGTANMLGCAENADEVSMPGPPARVGAEQLVFESDALLLSILQFHKTCLGWKSNKPSASRWKKSFASLLRVCDAFHRVGASVLWEEMDSMIPVLKLLPWYGDSERRYSGMGTHKYERELDWLRFQLYTSKIRRMRIARQCDVELPPHWTLELITLQGRPNPLFPSLQSITFGRGTHPSISCIVLLVNPSLQSVDITIQPLADTNGPVGVTASQPAETNLLAVLPAMSFSTPRLRKFDYQGPLNEKITHGLSNLRNLTSLHLEITNAASPVDLQGLQGFPQLKDLQVIAPNLQCTSPESVLLVKMGNLRKLEVATSDVCHFHLARLLCRAPKLNNLTLIVTSNVKLVAVCSALALYIGNCKQELQSLRVSFMSSQPAKEVTDALDNKNLTFWAEIEKELLSGLKGATSLQGMTFRDVPRTFAVAFIPILTSTVQYWRNLTTLAFHIQADNYGSPISYYGPYMYICVPCLSSER